MRGNIAIHIHIKSKLLLLLKVCHKLLDLTILGNWSVMLSTCPSPTLTPIKHFWTANILARSNHPEIVQYSRKKCVREVFIKYWNCYGNSLWAKISHLKYGCCTKQLHLLKVYNKLLNLHHTGNLVCDAVVVCLIIPALISLVSGPGTRIHVILDGATYYNVKPDDTQWLPGNSYWEYQVNIGGYQVNIG